MRPFVPASGSAAIDVERAADKLMMASPDGAPCRRDYDGNDQRRERIRHVYAVQRRGGLCARVRRRWRIGLAFDERRMLPRGERTGTVFSARSAGSRQGAERRADPVQH